MPHYHYLIVGGGMTAASAIKGIREVDTEGSIGLISAETNPPYDRPPLSKGLWKGKPVEEIWRGTPEMDVEHHLGRRANQIDPQGKEVRDDHDETYTYDRLLLATGGTPRRLLFGDDQILYFRTYADFNRLQGLKGKGKHFGVIGAGFIGSEIAAALAMNGERVSIIFPEAGIGGLQFPADLARYLNEYYREHGVTVYPQELVTGTQDRGGQIALQTESGKEIVVDAVVAGIGIQPNIELAESAGLETGDGVIVDEHLRTSQADIYSAGDLASFYSQHLDMRLRVEHEDNANTMGRSAGLNMAGSPTPYQHLPFFYSDLFDHGYEAVGLLDSGLETLTDWKEANQKGVVYYLSGGRVRGVLLWNTWDMVDTARALIAEPGPFQPADLKGRI